VVRSHKRLEELIPGEYLNTPFGDIYRARTTYDVQYRHGNSRLHSFWEVSTEYLKQLGRIDHGSDIDLQQTVFLDTEASGLSGGTGTYIFMVGLGYFTDAQFIVDQLFVDSYVKEEGMLDLLREYLAEASLLVTFNGKSFDLNLLQTRYLLHGQDDPFEGIPHLDLLHPCRNLWNLDLDNCRLQTLERDVLDFRREDDTPGEEVPNIYFEFIRSGDPGEIAGVFEHNGHDIVSLVAVTAMLEQNFQGIRHIPQESGLTMFSRGKIHERRGDYEAALECYTTAIAADVTAHRRNQIISQMAALYKQLQRWDQAVRWWQEQIESMPIFVLEPYRELAMYYEHQVKEYERAIEFVERALSVIPAHREAETADFRHRLQRLCRKQHNAG